MPQQSISISVRGDEDFRKAVKALAYSRGMDIAELVRSAIDKQYGHDLKPHLDFFYTQRGSKNVHTEVTTSHRKSRPSSTKS